MVRERVRPFDHAERREQNAIDLAVLHLPRIGRDESPRRVSLFLYQLVVLFQCMFRTLPHFFHGFTSRIEKEVQSSPLHSTFVGQCSTYISHSSATFGTCRIPGCEVGVGSQQHRVVCRSRGELSHSLSQQSSIVACQRIVWFLFQHEIEIAYRAVVVADKRSQ